jgi:hypothetical protein
MIDDGKVEVVSSCTTCLQLSLAFEELARTHKLLTPGLATCGLAGQC